VFRAPGAVFVSGSPFDPGGIDDFAESADTAGLQITAGGNALRACIAIFALILVGCSEPPEWHELARLDFFQPEGVKAVDRVLMDYPQFIEFGDEFSGPQGKGVFSYGHESTIRVWAPADTFRIKLRFSTHPVLAAAGQSLQLVVDGKSTGPPRPIPIGWTVDSLEARVELPKLEKGAPHTITLRAAVHANESEETSIGSGKPIAIFVKSLDIDAATSPGEWNRWVEKAVPHLPGTPRRTQTFRPLTVVEDTGWLVPDLAELPDILFIVLDAARADHFPMYGYSRNTTPNIAALAKKALVFDQMFSGASFTLTSTATLFTGQSWATHQLIRPGDVLPEEYLTMADILGLVGYWSLGISDNPNVSASTNLSQGFTEFFQTWNLEYATPGSLTRVFAERLEKEIPRHRPAFFYLHALPPHSPYTPPPEHDLWAPEGYSGDVDGSVAQLNIIHDKRKLPNEMDRERWISLYDANLHLADSIAQELIDIYHELGRKRPVWIVITSDHGEAFGDHGHYEHLGDIHDEMTHIPFVLWPASAWEGRVPDPSTFLSNGDVLPMILGALGLDELAASFENDLRKFNGNREIMRKRLPVRSHEHSGRFGMRSEEFLGIQGGHHAQYFYLIEKDPLQLRNLRRELDAQYTPWIGTLREWVQKSRPALALDPGRSVPEDRLLHDLRTTLSEQLLADLTPDLHRIGGRALGLGLEYRSVFRMREARAQMQSIAAELGEARERDDAAAGHCFEQRTLGPGPRVGRNVIDGGGQFGGVRPFECLDPHDALTHRREEQVDRKELGDPILPPESDHSGRGEDHGVELAFLELAPAGVQIAPEGGHLQIRAGRPELGTAPQAAGGHRRALAQIAECRALADEHHVPRIFPLADRDDRGSLHDLGRHILERMNRQIDVPQFELPLEGLGEDSDFTHLHERRLEVDVTTALDFDDLDLEALVRGLQRIAAPVGLPESQGASPRAQLHHIHLRLPGLRRPPAPADARSRRCRVPRRGQCTG
jgi:arylsulfatase